MLRWGGWGRRCNELTEAIVPCPRIVLQQVLSRDCTWRTECAQNDHYCGSVRTLLATFFELDSLFFCSIPSFLTSCDTDDSRLFFPYIWFSLVN
jgi:hypothetical protein